MGNIRLNRNQHIHSPLFQSNGAIQHVDIGSDVWIGYGVTILSGVSIGHGSVIGAGSVISKDVPPYSIVAGNPAKLLRMRFTSSQIDFLLKEEWREWPIEKINVQIPTLMRVPQERI